MSAPPILDPIQNSPTNILPESGSEVVVADVSTYALGIYADLSSDLYDSNFITGALDQVKYVYRELSGDVVDIELTEKMVYHAYESAVIQYSSLVNLWQAKNALPSALGQTTASFDQDGQITSANSGSNYALKYPKWDFQMTKRIASRYSTEANVGGDITFFTASIPMVQGQQTYDLQAIVSASAASGNVNFAGLVDGTRIDVRRVYYKSPLGMWRFFGMYGGMGAVGNLSSYGMYADDSTFEIIPTWQNKLQAMAYEDSLWTRVSHFSYDLRNNMLRIYPIPSYFSMSKVWIEFTIPTDSWSEDLGTEGARSLTNSANGSVDGVNNINSMPFSNLPYSNINAYGKWWIRRFALALCKSMLGHSRGKITSGIPFVGSVVQLNYSDLWEQSAREQEELKTELREALESSTYTRVAEDQSKIVEESDKIIARVPLGIYVG